jgi:myo-inositol 2-dehydrogenase/D-chiro-inositol 1-dehydrogenase
MSRLRVGLVGAGWIAQRHVPMLSGSPDVQLVAVCDTDITRAQPIADACQGRAYREWQDMLTREQLDVLWLCTPPLTHAEPAIAALSAGLHVYCEKPLARTLEDGIAIAEAADESAAVCAIAYQWHASELLEQLLAVVAGQEVGLMVGRNYGPTAGRPWYLDRAQGGGQIFERASHHIDLQRAIAGEVSHVHAIPGAVRLAGIAEAGDIEQVGALVLEFANGALGTIHMAWTGESQPHSYGFDVIATDATLTVQLGTDEFALRGRAGGRDIEFLGDDPFTRSAQRFLEAVRAGDPTQVFCTPRDALGTLRVALACERALETGQRQPVS